MNSLLTPADLCRFEQKVAEAFNNGEIRAPVHLYSGNEQALIDIFDDVNMDDWILCSWRSHYQCLLKGVPEEKVFAEIMAGRSISLCFPERRVFSSAIAGGILPIATGIAMAIKRKGGANRVYCFVGDMTAEMGITHECVKYSENHNLPISFVIEDNGMSVCTDTFMTWGMKASSFRNRDSPNVKYYQYRSRYPDAGAGNRVEF